MICKVDDHLDNQVDFICQIYTKIRGLTVEMYILEELKLFLALLFPRFLTDNLLHEIE